MGNIFTAPPLVLVELQETWRLLMLTLTDKITWHLKYAVKIQTIRRCAHDELHNAVIMTEYQLFKVVIYFEEARQKYQLAIYRLWPKISLFTHFHLFSFVKSHLVSCLVWIGSDKVTKHLLSFLDRPHAESPPWFMWHLMEVSQHQCDYYST